MVLDDKSFQNILTGFGQAKNGVVPVFLIHSHESFMMFMTEGMQLKAYPINGNQHTPDYARSVLSE